LKRGNTGGDMGKVSIEQIIDLDRYPIDRQDSVPVKALMKKGREALDQKALFSYDRNPGTTFSHSYTSELSNCLPG